MAVAVDHQGHGFKSFTRPPRCKLPSFTHLDYNKMLDFTQSKLTRFTNIHKSSSSPCLSTISQSEDSSNKNARIEIIVGHSAPRVRALVVEVAIAMASGVNPEPASSGLGGAYFLRPRKGETIAVAKPIDEEPLAFNNPKGFGGRVLGQPGMKFSIRIGETGVRESAAYLLDHDGFSGVPPTALVKFSHVRFNLNGSGSDSTKIASLQRFVKHDSDAGDLGPSSFSVASVHHIGILDVRLMNLDRHAGNILVRQGKPELVPIDHGFCLPESLDDPYFEWLHWPQASIPFSDSEAEYISCLDPCKDAEMLRTEVPSIGEASIRVLVLCTVFLKRATAHGLCLADIGEMMTREFRGGEENWSDLEKLCINAKVNTIFSNDYDANVDQDDDDDDDEEEEEEEDNDEIDEMFRIDDNQEFDVSLILQNSPTKGKPPKIPRFSSMSGLDNSNPCPLSKNEAYESDDRDSDPILDDNSKANGLIRSLSFPVPNYSHDCQGISFGEMNDKEWGLFLDSFEKLLPEAFEERKSLGMSKQRLGSSCEF